MIEEARSTAFQPLSLLGRIYLQLPQIRTLRESRRTLIQGQWSNFFDRIALSYASLTPYSPVPRKGQAAQQGCRAALPSPLCERRTLLQIRNAPINRILPKYSVPDDLRHASNTRLALSTAREYILAVTIMVLDRVGVTHADEHVNHLFCTANGGIRSVAPVTVRAKAGNDRQSV